MGPAKNARAARVANATSHSLATLAKRGNKPPVRAPSGRIAGVAAPPIPVEAPRADDHARGKVQRQKKHELAEAASALAGMNQEEEEEEEEDADEEVGTGALVLAGGATAAAADDDDDGADGVAGEVPCKLCITKPEPADGSEEYGNLDAIGTSALGATGRPRTTSLPASLDKLNLNGPIEMGQ